VCLVIACGALAHESSRCGGPAAGIIWTCAACRPICTIVQRKYRPPCAAQFVLAGRMSIFVASATAAQADCSTMYCARKAPNEFPGAHCYEFFGTGTLCFADLAEAEPGTSTSRISCCVIRAPG